MTYAVVILPEAEDDIIDAFLFIQNDSPMNANRWIHGLYEAIGALETFPMRFGLARENDDVPQELRQMIYKSHRIIFEIRNGSACLARPTRDPEKSAVWRQN